MLLAEEVRSLIHRLCDGTLDPVADLARVQLAEGGLVVDSLVHRLFPCPTSPRPRGVFSGGVVVGDDGPELLEGEGDGGHLVITASAVD